MIRRACALLLLACAACAPDRPGSDGAPPAASAFVQRAEDSDLSAAAYLVWSGDSTNLRTDWIDRDGRVLARRAGLFVAGGGTVWGWRRGIAKGRWIDCECMRSQLDEDAPASDCLRDGQVNTVDLVDLAGGRRIQVLAGESSDEMAEPVQGVWPLAGVGPYLLVEYLHDVYMCGAHGFGGASPGVFDLRTGAKVELVDSAEAAARVAAEGEAARAELAKSDMLPSDPGDEPRGVDLTEVEVRWTAAGTLDVAYQFTMSACYACSDGLFGSYSRSQVVPARTVPRSLERYLQAPEAVRRHWERSPPGERAGWSAVDAPDPAAALARFRGR